MKGTSMIWQPSSRSAEDSTPACLFARETKIRQPASGASFFIGSVFEVIRKSKGPSTPLKMKTDGFLRLRRRRHRRFINILENLGCAEPQQRFTNPLPQSHRVATTLLFAQDFRSIRSCHNRSQAQRAAVHFGKRSDGNLASASQLVQQGALAGRRGACRRVVQES